MRLKSKKYHSVFTTYNLFKALDCQKSLATILTFIIANPYSKKHKAFTYTDSDASLPECINFNSKLNKTFYLYLLEDNTLVLNKLWNLFVTTLGDGILNHQLDITQLSGIMDHFNEKLGESGNVSKTKDSKKISDFLSN